jgi:hypothetical protein
MPRALRLLSPVFALVAIGAGFLFDHLMGIGGESCDIYCGPGTPLLPLGLVAIAVAGWIAGIGFSLAGLITSRARSAAAWSGLALSVVLPVILIVDLSNA